MPNFKGLNHYSKGQTSIEDNGDVLVVTGFGETSLDGVSIETNRATSWEVTVEAIEISAEVFIGSTYNLVDNLHRVKTVGQWAITQSPDGQYAYLVVNSKLEGKRIELIGKKEGEEIFRREYQVPDDPDCNWIIVAIFVLAVASVILSNVDYTKITERDGQGNIIKTTTTKSFGGGGTVSASASIVSGSNPDKEDEEFDIDHLYVTSSFCYPDGQPEELHGEIAEVIITAKGIDQLVITDEVYSES